MFYFLSKTIYFVSMPLPFIVLLFIVSVFVRGQRWKKRLRYTAVILLLFFSNPYFSNLAMKGWEWPVTPLEEVEHHQVAVVLCGVTNMYKNPHDRVYFERGADRVLHTLHLYRLGRIDTILISGGSGKIIPGENDLKEAEQLAKVFALAGVPQENIIIENRSRNTHENADFSANILRTMSINKVLLVTSAFHMTRSIKCFKKQGIEVTPFATDYYSHDNKKNLEAYIVPLPSAINNWRKITKEIVGIVVYKIMGYI